MKQTLIYLTLSSVLASAPLQAKTLDVVLDLSSSNQFLSEASFSSSAAEFIYHKVNQLEKGDTVRLFYFGARDSAVNLDSMTRQISRKYRSKQAALDFATLIAQAPQNFEEGQQATNIIAFLEFTPFDCQNAHEIVFITDGLESSEYVSAKAFLAGKQSLPKPEVDLTGCNVTFYGLGAGWQPSAVKHVRNGWQAYFKDAGASFTPVIK